MGSVQDHLVGMQHQVLAVNLRQGQAVLKEAQEEVLRVVLAREI